MKLRMTMAASAAAISTALTFGGLAAPAAAQTDIKIGSINSYSGFLAQAGDEMDKGVALYVKTHEKDLPAGVNIEVIKRDDTSTPEVAKRLAQELITRDHVQILFGLIASPNAAAIAPLTARSEGAAADHQCRGLGDHAYFAFRLARLVHALAGRAADGPMGGEARLENRLHRGQRFYSWP